MTLQDEVGNLLELTPVGVTDGMKCLSFDFADGDHIVSIEQQYSSSFTSQAIFKFKGGKTISVGQEMSGEAF